LALITGMSAACTALSVAVKATMDAAELRSNSLLREIIKRPLAPSFGENITLALNFYALLTHHLANIYDCGISATLKAQRHYML
jgi:hypothetical protein